MKKIKKTLKAIAAIIKNPWLLNNILADDAVWQQYLEKNYQLKNGLPVVDINQLSPNFAETLDCVAFLDGSSLPTDFALLKSLTKKFKDCSYFEIGTWRGESVINVAGNCKECYTLNLSKEEILSLGLGEKYADLHGFFSKGKENIKHITGNSLTYDFKGLNKKFDVVVSRAVAPLKDLWHWSKPLLKKKPVNEPKKITGLICLKGGDLHKEIAESYCRPKIWEIEKIFEEPFFKEKYILAIS